LGTPAVTSRGMKEQEAESIGDFIVGALNSVGDEGALKAIAVDVGELCRKFPVYPHRLR
jgi:glycine hydroxymethyltransferase